MANILEFMQKLNNFATKMAAKTNKTKCHTKLVGDIHATNNVLTTATQQNKCNLHTKLVCYRTNITYMYMAKSGMQTVVKQPLTNNLCFVYSSLILITAMA